LVMGLQIRPNSFLWSISIVSNSELLGRKDGYWMVR
jgi:hypothetical protein